MFDVFKKSLWSKELIAWYLYDFANSFIIINIGLYFSQWVVVDQHVQDIWFSAPLIVATIILIFVSAFIGELGDKKGNHFKIFIYTTIFSILSATLIVIAGRILPGQYAVAIALVFFALYNFFIQLTFVPYGAFMKHISNPVEYGKISGIGFTFSEIGNIAGVLITLPIINGSLTVFGADHLAPLVPSLIAFFVFSLPIYFVLKNKKFPLLKEKATKKISLLKSFWINLMESRKIEGVFPLLIAFYLFSDAILTISLYSAIYMDRVFNASDHYKAIVFILVLIGFAVGAFLGGWGSDKYKHKIILVISLIITSVAMLLIAWNFNFSLLSTFFVLFGFGGGAAYASSRSYLASLVKNEESGTYFGLYAFAERFASVIGPAIWGIIILALVAFAPLNYRIAAAVLGFIVLLGVIPLIFMRSKKASTED